MTEGPHDQIVSKEKHFHDEWAADIDAGTVRVTENFSSDILPEPQWIRAQFGDLHGKKLLELGAGAGEAAVYFALQGAVVTATDLSTGMLGVVGEVAALHGVAVTTRECSAEDLSCFPDNSFDLVYAANLLHHVDIETCLEEVHRVLKPGGLAGFWDPLAHNPAINIYRRMATEVRTEDEHPIRRDQLPWFATRFASVQTRFFWLTTLLVFVKFYVIDRVHPNEDRYWKRILTEEAKLRKWYRPLQALDNILIRLVPPLRWWCWNIAIVVTK